MSKIRNQGPNHLAWESRVAKSGRDVFGTPERCHGGINTSLVSIGQALKKVGTYDFKTKLAERGKDDIGILPSEEG